MADLPFTHRVQVTAADIDFLQHANNVVYVRWIQEVAEAHWKTFATKEMMERYLWVVLRHEIDYHAPALQNELLTGTTWVDVPQGAKVYRYVKLFNETTGKVAAMAKTTWCLLDAKTMKPRRIEQDLIKLFMQS